MLEQDSPDHQPCHLQDPLVEEVGVEEAEEEEQDLLDLRPCHHQDHLVREGVEAEEEEPVYQVLLQIQGRLELEEEDTQAGEVALEEGFPQLCLRVLAAEQVLEDNQSLLVLLHILDDCYKMIILV